MESLPLDPRGYSGTYKLIGGRLSLDLVNTVSYPQSADPHDWLEWPANVVSWAAAVGLIGDDAASELHERIARRPAAVREDLSRLRGLRRVIAEVLTPVALGGAPSPDSVQRFNHELSRTMTHRTVAPTSLDWCWSPASRLDEVVRPAILDAARLLVEGDRERLGHCPACRWLYYDATRNRSRKWCDMADCGSRDKALRYYHRKRREEATGGS